jgi:short-subunit dehydrogenase
VNLHGKRIVLTGAASGIGAALLERLTELEVQVIAADRDEARLLETCARFSDARARIIPVACDISSQAGNDALFDRAILELRGVDVFIANAGFAYFETIEGADWVRLERIFAVNTLAPVYALTRMAALNSGKPFKVVWVASAMAHVALPKYAAYSAAKGALHRFAESYRWQMPDPKALMVVYPIATRTRFFAAASDVTPMPSPSQTPEEVAVAILRGIERDAKEVYPSSLFQVVLWLTLWVPGLRRFLQARELRS